MPPRESSPPATSRAAAARRRPARSAARAADPGAAGHRLGIGGDVLIAIGLLLAIAVAYAPVRDHAFVNFDDDEYVVDNPRVTAGLTREGAVWAFTHVHSANWHPLTWLSHMLDCELFGVVPGPHHVTNVLLHGIAALCLFAALRAMTGARWRSAAVAALFALHPRNVESVAWISERKDVLAGVFWTSGMWAYAIYARRPSSARYVCVAVLFALGLLSKPMLVGFPLALLLLDAWPLQRAPLAWRERDAGARWLSLLREKVPLLALALASSIVTFEAQRRSGAMATLETLPIHVRLENAVVAYATYLWKTAWPSGLAPFYPYRMPLPATEVAVAAAVLVAIGALAAALRRTRPYVAVGWLWYLVTLLPVIGIVRVGEQAMADRFTYLPLIGIYAAVVWGAADLAARRGAAGVRVAAAAAIAVLLCLLVATRAQVAHWRDSIALFQHALAVTRDNHLAEKNLAAALVAVGRPADAIPHARAAVRLRPGDPEMHANLGAALAGVGDGAAAREAYDAALRVDPENALAHFDLGVLLADQGRWEEARREYGEALRIDPRYAKAHAGMGWVLLRSGRSEEAVAHLRTALEIDGRLAVAANTLALALEDLGRNAEALDVWAAAVARNPEETRLRENYAAALAGQGRGAEAAAELRAAIAAARAAGDERRADELASRLAVLSGPPAAPAAADAAPAAR